MMNDNPWELTRTNPEAYADWQMEVRNGDTLRGFAEWLEWLEALEND